MNASCVPLLKEDSRALCLASSGLFPHGLFALFPLPAMSHTTCKVLAKTREVSGRFRNIHHLLGKETTGNTLCHPGLANSQLTEDPCMNVFPRTPTDTQFWVSLLFSSNEYHVGQPNTVKINLFNKLIEINNDDLEH